LDLDADLIARIAFDGRICISSYLKGSRGSQALRSQVFCFHVYKSCDWKWGLSTGQAITIIFIESLVHSDIGKRRPPLKSVLVDSSGAEAVEPPIIFNSLPKSALTLSPSSAQALFLGLYRS
jgi:hypothetical protein